MKFDVANTAVFNRGSAPLTFLVELVNIVRGLPDEIVSSEYKSSSEEDIFAFLQRGVPAAYQIDSARPIERKAWLCEVLRVLGGFESSWNWQEGRDTTNPASFTPCTTEAGIFQCSGNSTYFDVSLKDTVARYARQANVNIEKLSADKVCELFQVLSKQSHAFAVEYVCRLLRFTIRHHGPIKRGEILPWLREGAYKEFLRNLEEPATIPVPVPSSKPEPIRIVLDPGHGGHDSGALGSLMLGGKATEFTEKDIVLRVSNELLKILSTDSRFSATATRTTDKFLTLGDRSRLANERNAALLSIHANSGGGTGHEVYTYFGQSPSDPIATSLYDAYDSAFPELVGRPHLGDGDPDKEASFAVLRNTKGPAVLYELGFMDRREDLALMVDTEFPARAAIALYLGLLRAWNLGAPVEPPVSPAPPVEPPVPPVPPTPPVEPPVPSESPTSEEKTRIAAWLLRGALDREAKLPALLEDPTIGTFYAMCREAAALRDAARILQEA